MTVSFGKFVQRGFPKGFGFKYSQLLAQRMSIFKRFPRKGWRRILDPFSPKQQEIAIVMGADFTCGKISVFLIDNAYLIKLRDLSVEYQSLNPQVTISVIKSKKPT